MSIRSSNSEENCFCHAKKAGRNRRIREQYLSVLSYLIGGVDAILATPPTDEPRCLLSRLIANIFASLCLHHYHLFCSQRDTSMSAILSADDLNDFISPGVACIKPVETLPKQAPEEINVCPPSVFPLCPVNGWFHRLTK